MTSFNKKAKIPQEQQSSNASQAEQEARERLLSCPDHHHHLESEMVKRLEKLLNQKVELENMNSSQNVLMKIFDGSQPPKISIGSYLQRLIYYLTGIAEQERKAGSDREIHSDMAVRYLVTAIIYLERIQQLHGMRITPFNVHRLLITGTMIAAKVLDDIQPNQKYFADLGGISTQELTRLEVAFLSLCDYNVNVDPESFVEKYSLALERDRVFSDGCDALHLGAILSPRPVQSKVIKV